VIAEAHRAREATRIVSAICPCTVVGDTLAIAGAHSLLGNWDPHAALAMSTSEGAWPTWWADAPDLPRGTEFKLVVLHAGGGATWEPFGGNRTWADGDASLLALTFGRLG